MKRLPISLISLLFLLIAACTARPAEPEPTATLDETYFANNTAYEINDESVSAFEYASSISLESFNQMDATRLHGLNVSMTAEELTRLPADRREKIEGTATLDVNEFGVPLQLLEAPLTILHDGESLDAAQFLDHLTEDEVASLDPELKREITEDLRKQGLLDNVGVQKRSLLEAGE